jgi:hypothetical protein
VQNLMLSTFQEQRRWQIIRFHFALNTLLMLLLLLPPPCCLVYRRC